MQDQETTMGCAMMIVAQSLDAESHNQRGNRFNEINTSDLMSKRSQRHQKVKIENSEDGMLISECLPEIT